MVIRIHADEAGAIRLDVNDNGIGMRPGDVAIALQPFGQINRGDGRVSEGTGLGLPLTKRLV